ncbi:MAG: hypothetical protein HYX51_08800 [Chloroflexi bacterium]|nr:hypothetical protein [Chloroflexota bacterium]
MNLTLLSLWVHIPVVTAWIGLVMFDVFAAAAPGLEPGQRKRMLLWSRPFVIAAIILILLTGIRQTIDTPFTGATGGQVTSWARLEKLRDTTYGLALFWKHGAVLATFALTILVRFILAPRITAGELYISGAGVAVAQAQASSTLRLILWASVLNLAACLGALMMVAIMVSQLR